MDKRQSVLLGIYTALHNLFPEERANGWVRHDNDTFGAESALQVMLRGRVDDLYQVRRHLDAWRA